jgi:glutathione S-transferase
MITLYTFGPISNLPDASPFVIKAHVLLKMSGQSYETNRTGFRKAPKGKLPYIEDAGQVIADSTFIRWHLEKKYGIDFDAGLSAEQRAVAWAVEKMLEDNLYWLGVHWRWMDDGNFKKVADQFFKSVPSLLRRVLEPMVRGKVTKSLKAQGTGRHSEADMLRIGQKGIEALATLLGDKPFLMGEQPTGVDAMCFAIVTSALCPDFTTPMKRVIESHANLVAYEARMRQRFFAA